MNIFAYFLIPKVQTNYLFGRKGGRRSLSMASSLPVFTFVSLTTLPVLPSFTSHLHPHHPPSYFLKLSLALFNSLLLLNFEVLKCNNYLIYLLICYLEGRVCLPRDSCRTQHLLETQWSPLKEKQVSEYVNQTLRNFPALMWADATNSMALFFSHQESWSLSLVLGPLLWFRFLAQFG